MLQECCRDVVGMTPERCRHAAGLYSEEVSEPCKKKQNGDEKEVELTAL